MSDPLRLAEDKALRDAARELVSCKIARIKSALSERSIPARAMDRAAEGALDVLEQAAEAASRHKGVIAGMVSVLALWLARHPLFALLDDRDPQPPDSPTAKDMTDDHS